MFSTPDTQAAAQREGTAPLYAPDAPANIAPLFSDDDEDDETSEQERPQRATPSDPEPLPDNVTVPESLVPEYPTINIEGRDKPDRDKDRARRLRLMTGLAALGTAIAPNGGRFQAIGAGLTQGFGQAAREDEAQFAAEQQAYNEWLADAQEYNRGQRTAEAEARADVAQTEREAQLEQELEELREQLRNQRPDVQALTQQREAGAEANRARASAQYALAEDRRTRSDGGGEEPTDERDLYGELTENSRAMSEIARMQANARQKLEQMGLADDGRDQSKKRISRLQREFDDLATENARIQSRIESSEQETSPANRSEAEPSGNAPSGNAPSRQKAPAPTAPVDTTTSDGADAPERYDVETATEMIRDEAWTNGRQSALQRVGTMYQNDQIDQATANAILNKMNVE